MAMRVAEHGDILAELLARPGQPIAGLMSATAAQLVSSGHLPLHGCS